VPALVDTNVLVYRHDDRYPAKQNVAHRLLREGLAGGSVYLPHQVLVEYVAAVSRPIPGRGPLLPLADAHREAEELLAEFPVIYPNAHVFRAALRGQALYGLSWFDAHLWGYADYYGLDEILTEDFQHGRLYGTVRAVNPFRKEKR
jgi:predicted nucleic acid-binding protein